MYLLFTSTGYEFGWAAFSTGGSINRAITQFSDSGTRLVSKEFLVVIAMAGLT